MDLKTFAKYEIENHKVTVFEKESINMEKIVGFISDPDSISREDMIYLQTKLSIVNRLACKIFYESLLDYCKKSGV